MKLISDDKFQAWKEKRNISSDVIFLTSRSYFGKCIRSRPGAFFVTQNEITHWSYDQKDSAAAVFEKELKVTIKISEIKNMKIEKLSFFWKVVFLGARWIVTINTNTSTHKVIMYEEPKSFVNSVKALGVACI